MTVPIQALPAGIVYRLLALLGTAWLAAVAVSRSQTLAANQAQSGSKNELNFEWRPPTGGQRCVLCHPAEVEGYARSAMANSLRRTEKEPDGRVLSQGSTITAHSSPSGYFQNWENGGDHAEYRVEYAIGSGNHATGYLVDIGGHLFQSPIAYYKSRQAYDLAPGFENTSNPDFTRPISEECLLCHSGKALHVPQTLNWYRAPVFSAEAISCERCHGPVERHLTDPRAGTIVNPAKLDPPARDSICEQCHLFGATRVPNPGKKLSDFLPGQALENTYTIYHDVALEGTAGYEFKVISHVEQLALSACARSSGGRLWCGTCHDPHDKPAEPVAYYRARCLDCHQQAFPAAHPSKNSDCLACHMPKRDAKDGGHSAFTDHRIQRHAENQTASTTNTRIAPWREPPQELQERNLGIAYIDVGTQRHSSAFVVQGYRLLTEVQQQSQSDPEFFKWIGEALLLAKDSGEAKLALERALQLEPDSALTEASVAAAYLQEGDSGGAISHLERAVTLDPLYLAAASTLLELYQKEGKAKEAAELTSRISAAFVQQPNYGLSNTGGKKAEEVYKNIQAFKGVPAAQVIPAMQFMALSLGVECRFCHVESHFDRDDKKEKQTAREMIRMMLEINGADFHDQRAVTCNTCHRGRSKPASAVDLSAKDPVNPSFATGDSAALTKNLPTIDQVLSHYVEALGGSGAINRITSLELKGTIRFAGRETSIESFVQIPDQWAQIRQSPQGKEIVVYDGRSGWKVPAGGSVHSLTDAEADFARMDADPRLPLHLRGFFPDVRLEYPEKVGDRDAYVLMGIRKEGRSVKFYFDAANGLLLREARLAESPLGLIPTQIDYGDYRDVNGVKMAFRRTLTETGGTAIIQFVEVRQNVSIDPALFVRPAATVGQSAPAAKP